MYENFPKLDTLKANYEGIFQTIKIHVQEVWVNEKENVLSTICINNLLASKL
jgi:hypothetical protein